MKRCWQQLYLYINKIYPMWTTHNIKTNYQKIEEFILSNTKYSIGGWSQKVLNRNLLIKDVEELNEWFLNLLLSNEMTKSLFFQKFKWFDLFNQNKFLKVLSMNEFMDDSATNYPNKTGLFIDELDNISLNFPYKDCVLVWGMSNEDKKTSEIFYNELLEKDKIDKLFDPKIFCNSKKYSFSEKNRKNDDFTDKTNFLIEDVNDIWIKELVDEEWNKTVKLDHNLLVKWNNLLALHTLVHKLRGSVDIIYIDPPYYFNETKTDDAFAYNSNFKLSTWLTFMKNRLEVAHDLLSDKGVIFISMNEDWNSYLKLLCDEVFWVKNFINNFMWLHGKWKKDKQSRTLQQYNICYSNNKEILSEWEEEKIPEYKFENPDNDPKWEWFSWSLSFNEDRSNKNSKNYYTIESPSGIKWTRQWQVSNNDMNTLINDWDIFWWDAPFYKNVPRLKIRKVIQRVIPGNILSHIDSTKSADNELINIWLKFSYPKPKSLIRHLVSIIWNGSSIVLDFFAWSWTTWHAIMDLNKSDGGNRKFILVEQMDYVESITAERLKRCMVKYGYDNSFVYTELYKNTIRQELTTCDTIQSLEDVIINNFSKWYFQYVDTLQTLLLELKKEDTLEKMKEKLFKTYFDNTMEYPSINEITEVESNGEITKNDINVNNSFYKLS